MGLIGGLGVPEIVLIGIVLILIVVVGPKVFDTIMVSGAKTVKKVKSVFEVKESDSTKEDIVSEKK